MIPSAIANEARDVIGDHAKRDVNLFLLVLTGASMFRSVFAYFLPLSFSSALKMSVNTSES